MSASAQQLAEPAAVTRSKRVEIGSRTIRITHRDSGCPNFGVGSRCWVPRLGRDLTGGRSADALAPCRRYPSPTIVWMRNSLRSTSLILSNQRCALPTPMHRGPTERTYGRLSCMMPSSGASHILGDPTPAPACRDLAGLAASSTTRPERLLFQVRCVPAATPLQVPFARRLR